MNDAVRAAIMAFATSIVNLVVVLQVWNLDGAQLGTINLVIGNAVGLVALVWKKGQEAGT